ncbi:hypothetical protein A3L09_10660 (plasmid) [Thermococcus profundus]|uniref:Proliferating cell nuclear antigen PCNA N-terminal domain-containing protein n=1 Tax=Thermococcus profundus TaxID=49899 RepID=A0A2Z2MN43_THEPR|nr:hypothetical protein [Thermococcus profundus]ASJ03811.1 hypothetical protein A3L09_10660 [Thermococcus profundus]
MAFELALSSTKPLVDMLVAAVNLLGENPPSKVVILEVAEQGASLQITEPKRVAFVKIYIPRGLFLKYNIEDKELVEIPWYDLERVLKRSKSSDVLILKKGNESVLEVTFESVAIRTFRLPLLSPQKTLSS